MNDFSKLHPTLRAAAFTGALALTLAGCKSKTDQTAGLPAGDPADANMAQPYTGGDAGGYPNGQAQVMAQSESYNPQASGQSYEMQSPAPIIRRSPAGSAATSNTQYYPVPQSGGSAADYQQGYDQGYNGQYGNQPGAPDPNYSYSDAEEAGEQALAETDQAPPPLPFYDQPPAPEDDYIWTPGYWNYASAGYYWVPGVWCAPPFIGALWTPPWWGFYGGHYLFHRGYWGPHIGYYGGINYGFGYIGTGYFGGYWHDRSFYYNRAVTNVNITNIHNVYNRTVIYNNVTYGPHPDNRVSYNGGRGGITYQPRPQEIAAMHEAHYAPVTAQRDNRIAAAANRSQFFGANGGHPAQAFGVRPLGSVANVPAVPREQAFNHPTTNPAFNNNRPGAPNQPNVVNQPNGPNNRPGAPNPAFNNRPGEPNPALNNRPGAPNPAFNRPGSPNPALNNRPGASNPPANVIRPGEPTRAYPPGQPNGARPAEPNNTARPGFQPNQPSATERPNPNVGRNPQPNPPYNRPQPTPNPAYNRPQPTPNPAYNRPQPAPSQPNIARPNVETRPVQPQPTPRPNVEVQRPAPQFQQRSAPAPQPAARPNVEVQRPAPQIEQRSAPAPQPAARPAAPAPAPHAAPAPAAAPHGGGGGGERPHNR